MENYIKLKWEPEACVLHLGNLSEHFRINDECRKDEANQKRWFPAIYSYLYTTEKDNIVTYHVYIGKTKSLAWRICEHYSNTFGLLYWLHDKEGSFILPSDKENGKSRLHATERFKALDDFENGVLLKAQDQARRMEFIYARCDPECLSSAELFLFQYLNEVKEECSEIKFLNERCPNKKNIENKVVKFTNRPPNSNFNKIYYKDSLYIPPSND